MLFFRLLEFIRRETIRGPLSVYSPIVSEQRWSGGKFSRFLLCGVPAKLCHSCRRKGSNILSSRMTSRVICSWCHSKKRWCTIVCGCNRKKPSMCTSGLKISKATSLCLIGFRAALCSVSANKSGITLIRVGVIGRSLSENWVLNSVNLEKMSDLLENTSKVFATETYLNF